MEWNPVNYVNLITVKKQNQTDKESKKTEFSTDNT